MFCPYLLENGQERGAKVGDFTDVEAMHAELEAVRSEARAVRQEAAQREEALRSRLSLALDDKRKSTTQLTDLAAKLIHVQKRLEDEEHANGQMAMALEDALKPGTERREMQEIGSSSASSTCDLVLDETIFKLESELKVVAGGQRRWRLERAKVGGRTGGILVLNTG